MNGEAQLNTESLIAIASRHRCLLYSILAQYIIAGGSRGIPEGTADLAVNVVVIGVLFLVVFFAARLSAKLNILPLTILLTLLSVIPLVNLLVLLILSRQTIKAFDSVGIKVGFMGVKENSVRQALEHT